MSELALATLRARRDRLRLVIFDCDGVLIDSEPLCDRVVSEELSALGWTTTPAECSRLFLGMSFHDMCPMIEAELARPLAGDWVDSLVAKLTTILAKEVEAMPGARDVLEATSALGLPWRIASNSSHREMEAKFIRTGLRDLVAGRVHSSEDVIAQGGRGKPAPDLFLAAAAAAGIPPESCLVIEDSVHGVNAAVAAGMQCLGYCPNDDGDRLRLAGAVPFHRLLLLPDLLRGALEAVA
jgi:HAD superfamily hydrolase (TIGR01509 family)